MWQKKTHRWDGLSPLERAQDFERENAATREKIISGLRRAGMTQEDAACEADARLQRLFEKREAEFLCRAT